jgi:hypothetical protein
MLPHLQDFEDFIVAIEDQPRSDAVVDVEIVESHAPAVFLDVAFDSV